VIHAWRSSGNQPPIVTLPGAFVGVRLSTGSATQAGAVQILVLIALLLSETCGVAATIELVARGMISRDPGRSVRRCSQLVRAGAGWVRDRVALGAHADAVGTRVSGEHLRPLTVEAVSRVHRRFSETTSFESLETRSRLRR
jgi:hypothetical protein